MVHVRHPSYIAFEWHEVEMSTAHNDKVMTRLCHHSHDLQANTVHFSKKRPQIGCVTSANPPTSLQVPRLLHTTDDIL